MFSEEPGQNVGFCAVASMFDRTFLRDHSLVLVSGAAICSAVRLTFTSLNGPGTCFTACDDCSHADQPLCRSLG